MRIAATEYYTKLLLESIGSVHKLTFSYFQAIFKDNFFLVLVYDDSAQLAATGLATVGSSQPRAELADWWLVIAMPQATPAHTPK